ncbi:MAG: hypothetical protein ACW99A_15360 [Candidatus Kariarchaeaceae archaeon]
MPTKKELYIEKLSPLINKFKETENQDEIFDFLVDNSSLPGRRANLELASAFVTLIKNESESEIFFNLCKSFLRFNPDQAPTNDPKEFIPFCGIWGIGCIGNNERMFEETAKIIFETSHDSRWRIREAVAKSIHGMIQQNITFIDVMIDWIKNNDWLTFRAIAAGLADPSVLVDYSISKWALDIHWIIFYQIVECEDKTEFDKDEFKILQKGLNYTLSVVVAVIPKDGFKFMEDILKNQNPKFDIIKKIFKENLKKNRLIKNYPSEVAKLKELLS